MKELMLLQPLNAGVRESCSVYAAEKSIFFFYVVRRVALNGAEQEDKSEQQAVRSSKCTVQAACQFVKAAASQHNSEIVKDLTGKLKRVRVS